ncbi:translin-associated protein X [Leptidea sinapis]|uniref:translin-associated protein X n=1 Tax=Leptidea sinapis TaxID=189913 RepID=UPI002140A8C0|nr:translin-associated protein X [Leptidea sinapis]
MSGRGRHQGRRNNSKTLSSVARETVLSLPADSPVLKLFKSAANKLNERQDRHERLVKLSRDITIESKRIIFLLHTAITKESTEKVLKEANERLHKLINGPLSSIGLELENCPAYLHSRAVTAGFQEFIEARTLFSFMESKSIVTWLDVQKELTYVVNEEETDRTVVTMLPQVDYMLGLADLTGELMRRAINSISSGESEECFDSCQAVRVLYTGYLGLFSTGKELARKMSTTRSNVFKVESAMYALRVRGGEAPPTLLLVEKPEYDHHDASDDEGFFQSNKC